jgi:hypothetical protein
MKLSLLHAAKLPHNIMIMIMQNFPHQQASKAFAGNPYCSTQSLGLWNANLLNSLNVQCTEREREREREREMGVSYRPGK